MHGIAGPWEPRVMQHPLEFWFPPRGGGGGWRIQDFQIEGAQNVYYVHKALTIFDREAW